MTKDKIYLLDDRGSSAISVYTLGTITDNSKDVLCIEMPIFIGGNNNYSFDKKDLISKGFDVNSFVKLASFNIENLSDLLTLSKPVQNYPLKIGSSVRYKNKPYDVIGYYFNQFAQLNVVSPILFNSENLVNDVKSLFYALKSNQEVSDIINDNLRNGKYNNDFQFPLTATAFDYKDQLKNIVEPPFTTLETISFTKPKTESATELKPLALDIENDSEFDKNHERIRSSKISADIDFRNGVIPNYDQKALMPYNLIQSKNIKEIADSYSYESRIGNIRPIFKTILANNSQRTRGLYFNELNNSGYFFNILSVSDFSNVIYRSQFINQYLFSSENEKLKGLGLKGKEFIKANESIFTYNTFRSPLNNNIYVYVLKEDNYYGYFYNSSGNKEVNHSNDEKILPFGSVFNKSGIYYYVLKYIFDNNQTYCIALKCSTRTEIIDVVASSNLIGKNNSNIKKFTKEEVYKSFKKEGHIFKLPDSIFSTKSISDDKSRNTETPSFVTDLFIANRRPQIELIKDNFPELSESIFGILSLIDKSVSKSKKEILTSKNPQFLVVVKDNSTARNRYYKPNVYTRIDQSSSFDAVYDGTKKAIEVLKNGTSSFIDNDIYDLVYKTSSIYIANPPSKSEFIFALNSIEEYQKFLVTRLALNIFQNQLNYNLLKDEAKYTYYPLLNKNKLLSSNFFLSTLFELNTYIKKEDKEYIYIQADPLSYVLKYKFNPVIDFIKLAQSAYVLSCIQILYINAPFVIAAHNNLVSKQYIESSNTLNFLKYLDLSIDLDFLFENLEYINFYPINEINIKEQGNLSDKIYEAIPVFSSSLIIDMNDSDAKDSFKFFIKTLDLIYNYNFLLTERILEKKNKGILNDFMKPPSLPKVTIKKDAEIEIKEDTDDTDDIFSSALEELGDDFFESMETIDINDF